MSEQSEIISDQALLTKKSFADILHNTAADIEKDGRKEPNPGKMHAMMDLARSLRVTATFVVGQPTK
jgi:hypothetical protein